MKTYFLDYNNDWFADEGIYITLEELKKLIASKVFPQTPIEKSETLFLKLNSYHNEDGDYLNSPDNNYRHFDEFIDSILWKALYFKSHYEIDYYIDVLIEDGLIKKDKPLASSSFEYSITFKGLNQAIKLQQNGDKSNNCFVAMSFRNETQDI